jgi:hypothetical protein
MQATNGCWRRGGTAYCRDRGPSWIGSGTRRGKYKERGNEREVDGKRRSYAPLLLLVERPRGCALRGSSPACGWWPLGLIISRLDGFRGRAADLALSRHPRQVAPRLWLGLGVGRDDSSPGRVGGEGRGEGRGGGSEGEREWEQMAGGDWGLGSGVVLGGSNPDSCSTTFGGHIYESDGHVMVISLGHTPCDSNLKACDNTHPHQGV